MALTPEDVVNKRFQSTKFREGYDQDEVDDFLDEIVVELRRLGQENDELKQRLVAGDARVSELQRGGSSPAAQDFAAPPMFAAPIVASAPAPAPVVEPVVEAPAPVIVTPAPVVDEAADTNNLLQLARRLHEEHVREGVAKKEQLIADGHAEANRLVTEAKDAHKAQLKSLELECSVLQQRVDELHTFEREYRQQLRTYIQGQLSELDTTAQPAFMASPVTETSGSSGASAGSAPGYGSQQPFAGSAPSAPVQGYSAPQSPPPGQFPGYGS